MHDRYVYHKNELLRLHCKDRLFISYAIQISIDTKCFFDQLVALP